MGLEGISQVACRNDYGRHSLRNAMVETRNTLGRCFLDTMFVDIKTDASHTLVHSYGGYTTNLPLEDLLDGQAWVAFEYDGDPLAAEHGGPARLLVPHLYLWKSAKWVRGLDLLLQDEPGFWEQLGYHDYGDPWREQRYQGD